MYLYKATLSQGACEQPRQLLPARKRPPDLMTRTVGRELVLSAKMRAEHKDTASATLQIKGPKQAEALQYVEVRTLREQLRALPDGLLEEARRNYSLTKNNQQKCLQDFQCQSLIKIEEVLKSSIKDHGEDVRKYRIGGHDKATYERFFRVEPMQMMSKAQFTTAMRLTFGNDLIKFESIQSRLYDSFDYRRTDEMDWRSFLFLLSLLMQPTLFALDVLRQGYALYSSVGSFDATCSEPVSVGRLKRLLCAPCLLSYHSTVEQLFQSSYDYLCEVDSAVAAHSARFMARGPLQSSPLDPNDLPLPFSMFQKTLQTPSFHPWLQTAAVFGSRDPRPWSTRFEEQFYHPILLSRIKTLRREARNQDEAERFRALRTVRRKRFLLTQWKIFRDRRRTLRLVFIACELRAALANYAICIDHWRKWCVRTRHAILLQRVVRGLLARRRRDFLLRLRKKVTLVQKSSRSAMIRWTVHRERVRLYWAATTIQRVVRGRQTRRRVASRIEALYDQQRRLLEKEKEAWWRNRQWRACLVMQKCIRKFLRRRRTMKRLAEEEKRYQIELEIRAFERQRRMEDDVYRQEVSRWYKERKAAHALETLHEQQTRQQKQLILQRRFAQQRQERLERQQRAEEEERRREEEKIELRLKQWEEEIQSRGKQRRVLCRNCLTLPETPEQVALKKKLQKRIKEQIKDVLRRADAAKIPMEIPQAQQQATEEVIELEAQEAMRQGRADMQAEGKRLEEEKVEQARLAAESLLQEKKRKAKWAVVTIQCYARVFLARKRIRARAYQCYRKHFDIRYHEYYYEDRTTGETSWEKPKVLGSYDIDMEPYWVILHSREGERLLEGQKNDSTKAHAALFYYYNPATWDQRWTQPRGTLLCSGCTVQFAEALVVLDGGVYCHSCLTSRCEELCRTMRSQDINLRIFSGGREDAARRPLDEIPVISWYTLLHTSSLDRAIQMREQEEQQEEQRERQRAEQKRQAEEAAREAWQRSRGQWCEVCASRPCDRHCEDCDKYYCRACRKSEHKSRWKKYHFMVPCGEGLLPSSRAGSKSKHKKKKKKKKKRSKSRERGATSESRSGEREETTGGMFPPIAGAEPRSPLPLDGEEDEPSLASEPYPSDTTDSGLEASSYSHSPSSSSAASLDGEASVSDLSADSSPAPSQRRHRHRRHRHKHRRTAQYPEPILETDEEAAPGEGEGEDGQPRRHRRHRHHRHRHRRSHSPKGDGENDAERESEAGSSSAPDKPKRRHRRHKSKEKAPGESGGEEASSDGRKHRRRHRKHRRHGDEADKEQPLTLPSIA